MAEPSAKRTRMEEESVPEAKRAWTDESEDEDVPDGINVVQSLWMWRRMGT